MNVRIFQPARTAMSSGTAKTKHWVLEFTADQARQVDPLMGWTSSSDTQAQVRLQFDSKEAAIEYAESKGISLPQFAMAWLLNNRDIASPIAGPRTMAQWNDYARALDYVFTAEDEDLVNRLVPIGHPSTPGYNDPQYPIRGRRTFTS